MYCMPSFCQELCQSHSSRLLHNFSPSQDQKLHHGWQLHLLVAASSKNVGGFKYPVCVNILSTSQSHGLSPFTFHFQLPHCAQSRKWKTVISPFGLLRPTGIFVLSSLSFTILQCILWLWWQMLFLESQKQTVSSEPFKQRNFHHPTRAQQENPRARWFPCWIRQRILASTHTSMLQDGSWNF